MRSRTSDDKSQLVDALFAGWSARRGTPGAAVRVTRDGEVVHAKEYGLANLEANLRIIPETKFLLASLTKQFTAMAIMMLHESDGLRYEEHLCGYFPQFKKFGAAITIRQLLHHTSGLPKYEDIFLREKIIEEDWPRSMKSPLAEYEPTSADALDLLSHHRLDFSPGDRCDYSNSGYVALAQIVEAVSGNAFPAFVKEKIFEPLRMNDSALPVRLRPYVPIGASSYSVWQGTFEEID